MKHFVVFIDKDSRIKELDGPFSKLDANYIAQLFIEGSVNEDYKISVIEAEHCYDAEVVIKKWNLKEKCEV